MFSHYPLQVLLRHVHDPIRRRLSWGAFSASRCLTVVWGDPPRRKRDVFFVLGAKDWLIVIQQQEQNLITRLCTPSPRPHMQCPSGGEYLVIRKHLGPVMESTLQTSRSGNVSAGRGANATIAVAIVSSATLILTDETAFFPSAPSHTHSGGTPLQTQRSAFFPKCQLANPVHVEPQPPPPPGTPSPQGEQLFP